MHLNPSRCCTTFFSSSTTGHSASCSSLSLHRLAAVPSVLLHHEADGQVPFPQDQEDAIEEGQATAARASSQEHREACQQGVCTCTSRCAQRGNPAFFSQPLFPTVFVWLFARRLFSPCSMSSPAVAPLCVCARLHACAQCNPLVPTLPSYATAAAHAAAGASNLYRHKWKRVTSWMSCTAPSPGFWRNEHYCTAKETFPPLHNPPSVPPYTTRQDLWKEKIDCSAY